MTLHLESWIMGFIDGEGCFCVSFSKVARLNTGLDVRPSFSVSQKRNSKAALHTIHDFFGCGGIRSSNSDGTEKYEVRKLQDLNSVIIPFFQKTSLLTEKQKDFVLFSRVCSLMKQNRHHSKEGLIEIIELSVLMNSSGKRKYSKEELLDILNKHC